MTLKKEPQKILITRTDRIGDLILSTPAITAVKKKFPKSRIYVMCLPPLYEILAGNPDVDEVIVYDKRGDRKSFFQSLTFAFSVLRPLKFDLAIHLHPTNRVHLLSFFAGIPHRIGYQKKMGFLLTQSIPEKKSEGLKSEAEYNFDLLELLDISKPEILEQTFHLDEVDEESFIKLEEQVNQKLPDRFVAVHAASSDPQKCWLPDRFAEVLNHLWQKYQLPSVFVADTKHQAFTDSVTRELEGEFQDWTGLVDLRQLAFLFSKSQFLLSNDSGPVHIASALGMPVLSLFGRTEPGIGPIRWRPIGPKSHYIIKPYENKPNPQLCFDNLTSKDVLAFLTEHAQTFGLV